MDFIIVEALFAVMPLNVSGTYENTLSCLSVRNPEDVSLSSTSKWSESAQRCHNSISIVPRR